MAGYSGTPLAKKLGIKEGSRVSVLSGPRGFRGVLKESGGAGAAYCTSRAGGPFDVVVLFTKREVDLASRFGAAAGRLTEAGGLWVAWPKRASGVATDLTEDTIRELGLAAGLVDNKVCAIDEVWSGLRFVKRVRDRAPKQSR
ncbi:MAG: DUF3052 family protein [Phycisphaerales bacterium]